MLKRVKRLVLGVTLGILLLACAVFVLSRTLCDHDVLFQDKPIGYWVTQTTNSDTAVSNRANVLLNTQIIPHLTETMFHDTNDSQLRLKLVSVLNGIPGVNVVFTPAAGRRAGAAHYLGWFGPPAKAAIPSLIEALKSHDEPVRGPAAQSLGEIHCEPDMVIPLLIGYLDDTDLNDEAAEALGKFGGLARAAVPKLIPLLKINDKDVQEAVRTALKKIDPEAAAKAGVD